MVIYADILIIVNLLVDFFLLRATALILGKKVVFYKLLLSSILGGISSLYIFMPEFSVLVQILYKFLICALMVLMGFGFLNIKAFLRSCGVLFAVTCGYGGIMQIIWYTFKPKSMTIINSVIYFNISPVFLIVSSVVFYFIFKITLGLLCKTAVKSERCEITITADGKTISMSGIIDTGNSLTDSLNGAEVIISDQNNAEKLFGDTDITKNKSLKNRYRIIPCNTVSGKGMLTAFRCDEAEILKGKEKLHLKKPLLAVSKTTIKDDYSAIVNPKIFY